MNNPLELLLRRQKAAQGGRIGFFGGGGADMGDPDRAGERADRGYGLGNQNDNKGNDGGTHGGNDPQAISAQQMSEAEPGDYGGFDPSSGGNKQTELLGIKEDDKQYTNNFLESLFNKNLTFKYNPKMDYLNRMYGRIPDFRKDKILKDMGLYDEYNGDFDSFLKDHQDSLYDNQNITGKEIAAIPGQVYDYFTGIPKALSTTATNLTNPSAYQTMGENIFSGVFSNPITTMMGMNPIGFVPGMFASLAFGKGPFTDESIESGNYADLTNAPTDYKAKVKDAMGGAFNAEQIAQMATGALNQQQQQSATQGPQDTPIDQATLDQQSMQQYLDGLSESEAARYEQLINSGYTDDYAKAYLGLM